MEQPPPPAQASAREEVWVKMHAVGNIIDLKSFTNLS